jgi:hypothetical protein
MEHLLPQPGGFECSTREVEVQMAWMEEHLARGAVEATAASNDVDPAVVVRDVTTRLDISPSADPAVEMDHKTAFRPVAKLPAPRMGATDTLLVLPRSRVKERGREPNQVMACDQRDNRTRPD